MMSKVGYLVKKMNAYKCFIVFPASISGHTCAPTGETL